MAGVTRSVTAADRRAAARVTAGRTTARLGGELLAGQLVLAAGALVVNVLAARAMGPAGRGGLALGLQLSYVATALGLVGVDRSYLACVTARMPLPVALRDQCRLLAAPALAVAVASLAAGLLIPAPLWTRLAGAAAFALAVAAGIARASARTAAIAAEATDRLLRLVFAGQLLQVVLCGLLFALGVRAPAAWLATYGLAALPVLGMWRGHGPTAAPTGPRHDLRAVRRLGLRLLPAAFAHMAMLRADRLLLPWLASLPELGVYAATATLTELVAWPVQSYVDAAVPRWRARRLDGSLRRLPVVLAAVGYSAASACVLVVAGRWLVVPLLGRGFAGAEALLPPLAAAAALYSLSRVGVGLCLVTGAGARVLAVETTGMLTALAGYVVLIPAAGAQGAAYASIAGYGVATATSAVLGARR